MKHSTTKPATEGGLIINTALEELYLFKRPKCDDKTAAETHGLNHTVGLAVGELLSGLSEGEGTIFVPGGGFFRLAISSLWLGTQARHW